MNPTDGASFASLLENDIRGGMRDTEVIIIAFDHNEEVLDRITTLEQFGNSVEYDKVILSDDMSAPIDENTVFFIDTPPAFDDDGNPMFDYIVRKVAKSLNTLAVAISKVRSV